MSTEFYNVDGELVAYRTWGGEARGTVVELQPDAVKVRAMDEPLYGTDGSQENLRTLAEQVGRGRLSPAEVEQKRRDRDAAERERRARAYRRAAESSYAKMWADHEEREALRERAQRIEAGRREGDGFAPCHVCETQTRYRSRHNGQPCCGACSR